MSFVVLSACTVVPAEGSAPPPPATGDAGCVTPCVDPSVPPGLVGTWLDRWSVSMQYALARDAYDFERGLWFGGRPSLWDMAPARGIGLAIGEDGTYVSVRSADGGLGVASRLGSG